MVRSGKEGKLDLGKPETWPGAWSDSLEALAPAFRVRVARMVVALAAMGYRLGEHYVPGSTWRSKERQRFIVDKGWSRTMRSKHAVTAADGTPAAMAVDMFPLMAKEAEKAAFYTALMASAEREGLVSGGSWGRTNATWAKYGLGWDPGHVEAT